MLAAIVGCEACTAALLELGADVGATDATGKPALHRACVANLLPIVRQLIAAGAAKPAVFSPGSRQSRLCAHAAIVVALDAELAATLAMPAAEGANQAAAPTGWTPCVRCWQRACGKGWAMTATRWPRSSWR
jgi:ankyrin repeat protein